MEKAVKSVDSTYYLMLLVLFIVLIIFIYLGLKFIDPELDIFGPRTWGKEITYVLGDDTDTNFIHKRVISMDDEIKMGDSVLMLKKSVIDYNRFSGKEVGRGEVIFILRDDQLPMWREKYKDYETTPKKIEVKVINDYRWKKGDKQLSH